MQLTVQLFRSIVPSAATAALSIFSAGIIGWLASEGDPLLLAVPIAALAALYLATKPIWLLWGALIGGLLISGLARLYVPELQQIRWALAPLALVLALHAIHASFLTQHSEDRYTVPSVVWWAFAFLSLASFSTLTAGFSLDRLLIGSKGYFQVWGLLLALALFPWPPRVIDRIPRFLLTVALIQIPFVVHQLLFLVPKRVGLGEGVVPVDIVAGSFGASFEGGGANATLNAFLIIVISGLIAARQLATISTLKLSLFAIPLLLPVFTNMAKVSVLYLFAAFLVLFAGDIRKKPLRFVIAAVGALVLLAMLFTAYTISAPSQSGVKSWQDLVRFTYAYNVAEEEVGGTGVLSRGGALRYWAQRHGIDNPVTTLFGHGLGFTRVSDEQSNFSAVARTTDAGIPITIDLSQRIGNTSVSALLWETGLFGLIAIFALLGATYLSAGRLEIAFSGYPERVAAFRATRVAMLILFVSLWHKNSLVFDVAYQTLFLLFLGYTAYWSRVHSLSKPYGHLKHEKDARPSGNATSRS